ncbi:transcriptional regulator [Skermanella stibiiresistens SB22]|uniref:Transcriptional regulator n=1 Tax=Skermanella stibiiresistens SB22 TaxID=1385369 RepID=W9H5A0_9PROT|nr:PLP-dependent aminotransferase family protein [Skermanella stibiiresistens]EWY38938.1 transcriptional regulator [Skermanella stibiiresistens SB22]
MTNWAPDLDKFPGPRYRAIADALAADIAANRLTVGTRLPTHRDLAFTLKVTVGTITRAYAEAERRGLIGGEVGRGTYVKSGVPQNAADAWPQLPPPSGDTPALVDMSLCTPSAAGVAEGLAALFASMSNPAEFAGLLEYPPHGGLPAHRAAGATWLSRHQIAVGPENVLVTSGAQNGMAIAFSTVARPGDLILTERLTYFGMKALTSTLGLRLEGIAMDEDGILPDAFESACRQSAPRALYTVPTLHNPTTAIMPLERRRRIVEIARQYDVTIVEDDVFGFLVPEAPSPIQMLAPDITLHISSLSKSIAPGLRIGYLVAPSRLMPRLTATMRALNYAVPPLMGEMATRWIEDGSADRFAETQRRECRARQALTADVLRDGPAVAVPSYGQHLWLKLPEPWRREDFVAEARARGIIVTGADVFTVGRGAAPHAVRIGISMPERREDLRHGLEVLADLLASPVGASVSMV